MDLRKVKKLIELLENSVLQEIEIHEGEESIRIRRDAVTSAVSQPKSASVEAGQIEKKEVSVTEDSPAEKKPQSNVEIIRSPIVGVFYTTSAPGQPPYVKVGQKINKGQVVCIIEAMKVMNQISSNYSGTLSEILVNDGDPVQYNQDLFVIQL